MKIKKKLILVLHIICAVLPQRLKILIYRRTMAAEIESDVHIGTSFIHARKLVLKRGSFIGNFNILRNIERLELGQGARIGNRNYATALPFDSKRHFGQFPNRFPALIIGNNASITGNHFFDCNDQIRIGDFSILAGRATYIYTHGISVVEGRQHCAPVTIGNHCMVAARCILVKGAGLPDCSVLGAQSVLVKHYSEPYKLYSGNPATPAISLPKKASFFSREVGYVD